MASTASTRISRNRKQGRSMACPVGWTPCASRGNTRGSRGCSGNLVRGGVQSGSHSFTSILTILTLNLVTSIKKSYTKLRLLYFLAPNSLINPFTVHCLEFLYRFALLLSSRAWRGINSRWAELLVKGVGQSRSERRKHGANVDSLGFWFVPVIANQFISHLMGYHCPLDDILLLWCRWDVRLKSQKNQNIKNLLRKQMVCLKNNYFFARRPCGRGRIK